ncbi:amidohydrolase family protein [Microbacterium yannicii]|uniref:amidohydrolase family protein n=1 Tax=Microbacterium yannicii TaxID=671622 RepID=UPI0003817808|nr:amidohydrolase family protein [Microbacterium yannicii]
MTTVDSHHHLWPLDAIHRQPWRPADDAVLRRAFELGEFERALDESGIDGSILMQSVDAADENQRLAAYAASSSRILGWVGYADLPGSDPECEVAALAEHRTTAGGDKLVGLRCLVGDDPMAWASQARGLAALRSAEAASLVWDVVPITDAQVDAVCRVSEALPGLRIVVDHLASPPVDDDGARDAWIERLRRLAASPQVAIKLSVGVAVLQRWEEWDEQALRPYVDAALEHFGPQRCMVASNWPVVLLRASHAAAWQSAQASLGALAPAARDDVLGGTALRWYGVQA